MTILHSARVGKPICFFFSSFGDKPYRERRGITIVLLHKEKCGANAPLAVCRPLESGDINVSTTESVKVDNGE